MRKFLINLFSADEKRVSTLIVALFLIIGYGFYKGFDPNTASIIKWLVIGVATVNVANPKTFQQWSNLLSSENQNGMYGNNYNSYDSYGYNQQNQYGNYTQPTESPFVEQEIK